MSYLSDRVHARSFRMLYFFIVCCSVLVSYTIPIKSYQCTFTSYSVLYYRMWDVHKVTCVRLFRTSTRLFRTSARIFRMLELNYRMWDVHKVTWCTFISCQCTLISYTILYYRMCGVHKVTCVRLFRMDARLFRASIPFYRLPGVYKVTLVRLFRTHCQKTCTVRYM